MRNDFGHTLASGASVKAPYIVLPFLGPDPPRDAAGQVVDIFLDPTTYIISAVTSTGRPGREVFR